MYLQSYRSLRGIEGCLCVSGIKDQAHTVKPEDDAQTLEPSELNMAALSILPEATRLDLYSAEQMNGSRNDRSIPGINIRCSVRQLVTSRKANGRIYLPCHDMATDCLFTVQ